MAAPGPMPTWSGATQEERAKVLRRLGHDQKFYEKAEIDPVGAFAEEGISLGPGEVPTIPVSLPSMHDILKNLAEEATCSTAIIQLW